MPPGPIFIEICNKRLLTEEDYADQYPNANKLLDGYQESKIKAERAAWAFCKENNLEMATVHPSYTIGPSMSAVNRSASMDVIDGAFLAKKNKKGKVGKKQPPALPVGMQFVDVRDIAKIHVEAMERSNAAGKRFIGHNKTVCLTTAYKMLAPEYPVKTNPPCCLKPCVDCCDSLCCCCLSGNPKMMVKFIKKTWKNDEVEFFDNKRSQDELGIKYIPLEQTLKDHAKSWNDHNMDLGAWLTQSKSQEILPLAASAPSGEQIAR